MRPVFSCWLVASSILVRRNEKLALAISAEVHLIIFTKGQVLGPVRPLSVLISCPSSFCEHALGISFSDHLWVHKFESSTVENKDPLDAFLLADVLDVAECFSVKVQVMLSVILFLEVLGDFSQVGEEGPWVSFHDVGNQEFYELLL